MRSVGKFGALLQISTGFMSWQRYCTALAKLCGVEQRAPLIFGRAAITLGIGPHCSLLLKMCNVSTSNIMKHCTTLENILVHPKDRTGDQEKLEVICKLCCKN